MIDWNRQFLNRFFLVLSLLVFLVGDVGCSVENPEIMFRKGIDAIADNNLDEAVIWFEKALQQNPEMALAHYKLGEVYRKKGDAKLAYAELSRALQQDPKLKDARKELAFLLVEYMAISEAVKVCEKFLQVNGNDEEVYLILGNALNYTKKSDEAVKVLETGRKLYPGSIPMKINLARILVAAGNIEEGRSMMEALALGNQADIVIQLGLAQIYEKLQLFDLEGEILESLKEKYPENSLSYLFSVQLALQRNQPDKAKSVLADAEGAGVKNSRLYRMHASILHRQGDHAGALQYYEKAVEVATEETRQSNRMILADYHTYLKNYKEAQEIVEIFIAEDNRQKRLKSKVVELFMAQGQFDQAPFSVDSLLKEDSSDARGHYLSGLMAMQNKEFTEARKAFSTAKSLAPYSAENQFMYGMTFMDEASPISITEIGEALKKDPNFFQTRYALAEIYARKGEFEQSLDELDKIVGKHTDNIEARVLRVAVLLKMKKFDMALTEAKLLVEAQPDVYGHRSRLAEVYHHMGEFDKALSLYEELQREERGSVQILNRIVDVFMQKEEPEKAMAAADSFLVQNPNNSAAVMIKAEIYYFQGHSDLAENVLMPEVVKRKAAAPVVMLAELYESKNEVGKAVEYLQKAINLAPDDVGIRMKLAELHIKNRNSAAAIASYEEALRKKNDLLPAMNNLAFLYAEEGGDLNRALEYATTVYKKLPKNPDVADTLGWVYVLKSAYSQAEPYLRQALVEKPENPIILYHMAILRYNQQQQQEAETLLTKAIEKGLSDKPLSNAKDTLTAIKRAKEKIYNARNLKEQGNVEQAMLLFKDILDNEGFYAEAAAELAVLYAEQNKDISRAVELAKEAYLLQPSSPQVADALGWVYCHQGAFLLAKQYLEQALTNNDEYGRAHFHLGAMYLQKGELAAGKKELEAARAMKLSTADLQRVKEMLQNID